MSHHNAERVVERELDTPVALNLHELGNLVSIIIAEAQLLQIEYEPGTPGHVSGVAIERAARRVQELIGLSSRNGTSKHDGMVIPEDHTPPKATG